MKRPESFIDELSAILIRHHVMAPEESAIYKEQYEQSDLDEFEDFLLEEGLVTKEELLEALGAYYEVPWVDMEGILIDPELVRNFPKDFLVRNEIIPIQLEEDFLTVAAAHPDDETLLANIGKFVDVDVRFQVSFARDITDAVKEFYDHAVTEVPDDVDLNTEHREEDEAYHQGEFDDEDED